MTSQLAGRLQLAYTALAQQMRHAAAAQQVATRYVTKQLAAQASSRARVHLMLPSPLHISEAGNCEIFLLFLAPCNPQQVLTGQQHAPCCCHYCLACMCASN